MTADESYVSTLLELLKNEQYDELRVRIRSLDPADLADFLEEVSTEDRDKLFEMLDVETASDVIVELEPTYVDQVVETMSYDQIAGLADQMAPDDAADFLADLEVEQRSQVLAAMEEPGAVSQLLPFPEDSAGHIMTTEICAVSSEATVAEAKQQLGQVDFSDPLFYVYVVDSRSRKLLGLVLLTDLLGAQPDTKIQDLADSDFVFCFLDDDQEDVARSFRKYDLWVIPVVDRSHRLVGRITVDDVMDVVHEEADEDLAHMVGAPDIEEEEISPFRIVRMRLPWLMITMFVGLLNSVIIASMLEVTNIAAIAIFVPAILAMGGNTGMQSSAIAVRGIALGLTKYGRLMQIAAREIFVGFCLGICCGTVAGLVVWGILTALGSDTGSIPAYNLALAVAFAVCSAMTFASFFGSVFPVLLHRLNVDPAVASGPFVTTSNDLSSALIYFLTCLIFLKAAL